MIVQRALAITAVAVIAGCAGIERARGTFLATPLFEGAVRLSEERVRGTACKWAFLVIPIGDDSLGSAWANALAKSPPGTIGLEDAVIEVNWPLADTLLIRRYCTTVSGFPARR